MVYMLCGFLGRIFKSIETRWDCKTMRNNIFNFLMFALLPVLVILALTDNVLAADLLAAGQQVVTDTFGPDSSIATWIILGEVIFGIISYIKTKNIMLLFGVVVVVVFTTIGFGLAA